VIAALLVGAVLSIPAGPARPATVDIPVAADWTVHVMLWHDDRYLYARFSHLRHGGQERYPELLFDPALAGGDAWHHGQWWLHSSYNLCEGDGAYNVYDINGVFQCAKTKPGFAANHFPLIGDGVMDIRIALDKFDPALGLGREFGFALDVTDTHSAWAFWPVDATLQRPATWGRAVLVSG
jgi:hypothetical protein